MKVNVIRRMEVVIVIVLFINVRWSRSSGSNTVGAAMVKGSVTDNCQSRGRQRKLAITMPMTMPMGIRA